MLWIMVLLNCIAYCTERFVIKLSFTDINGVDKIIETPLTIMQNNLTAALIIQLNQFIKVACSCVQGVSLTINCNKTSVMDFNHFF